MKNTAIALLIALVLPHSWGNAQQPERPLRQASAAALAAAETPNIIVIMADDLGYGDVGCYGAKPEHVKTPHIDRLAARGLRFTSGYASASTCTPTRYSLLTGTYAFRNKGTGIAGPTDPSLIQPGIVTLPALLQTAGYKTAVIGKWHLGLGAPGVGPQWNGELKPGPLEIGFDYCFLLPTTNDRVPQVYVENHRVLNLDPADPLWVGHHTPSPEHPTGLNQRDSLKMDWSHGHNSTIHNGISRIGFYTGGHAARFRDEDLADKWVEKSEQWITQNKDNPFFLYFASHDIHVPRMPHERFHGQSGMGLRGDAIVEFDWCVGELIRILKEQGLEENTMIILCSDNGPVLDDGYKDGAVEKLGDHKPAGTYSGGKYQIMEGGTRTPFITYWPGTIKPGVSDQVVSTIDFAGSLATYMGVDIPDDACLDSIDVMDTLLGKDGAEGRSQLIEQDNWGGSLGYREGKWKLQRLAKYDRITSTVSDIRFQLFDLDNDPAEKQNVMKQHPEVFERMKSELQKLLDDGRSRPANRKNQASQTAKSPNAVEPTFKDVSYGAHKKELMNFWQFKSEKPVGVLLQIHGGGWMGGNKDETLRPHKIKNGYSVASISYPLVNEGAQQPEMLNAALRSVQFLRYKAKEWNIDPQRIVVTGGSAGGCSSLLVALHDDVADPDSSDPVERFSSRVAGAMVAGAQTTMNPFVIKQRIGEKTFENPMPYKPFGAETAQELMDNWDTYKALSEKCSPITHLSKDDPPLHLYYNVMREFPTTKGGNGIHSPIFGEIMLEACQKMGVECHLQYWQKDEGRPKPAVSRQEFINRLLSK